MKRIQPALAAILGAATSCLPAAEFTREGAMEKKLLFAPGTTAAWSASESRIQDSRARMRAGAPSLQWHITVDHAAGEAKYPVGWPRISRTIPEGPIRDWSGWDFLRMWIYTATSRARLPGTPAGLGLHTPDRPGAYNRTLAELRKGEWVEIRVPLSQVPRHHDVRQIQFHIAESNYQHSDELDFYLADLALLRYANPKLLNLAAAQAVLFDDVGRVSVRVDVAGVREGATASMFCELWRQGRVVARTSAPVTRGTHRLVMTPDGGVLAPGSYVIQAGFAGQGQSAETMVRVVETPWK